MQVLKDYLAVAGITQAELARRAEMEPADLNRIINGDQEPRIAKLRKLSQATGITIERLVADVK